MLYVPRHLSNKLEYKVLSCISVHYQSRMTNNGIAITLSRFHRASRVMVLFKINMLGGGGIVPCVSNKTVISIIMYLDRVLDFLWLCYGYWTRLVLGS
jgi:hypothetical protein